jgi:putative ABC transport system permease protein
VTLVGVAVGLLLAFAATRVLASILYDVNVRDPFTFAGTTLVIVGVAALASYPPDRRRCD